MKTCASQHLLHGWHVILSDVIQEHQLVWKTNPCRFLSWMFFCIHTCTSTHFTTEHVQLTGCGTFCSTSLYMYILVMVCTYAQKTYIIIPNVCLALLNITMYTWFMSDHSFQRKTKRFVFIYITTLQSRLASYSCFI